MKDREGNEITMTEYPNQHVLIWGQSGQGKTFCTYRHIEKAVENGKHVLILDFSGSYSQQELKKNRMKMEKDLIIHDIFENDFYWQFLCRGQDEFVAILSDALMNCLEINSYYQRKLIRKVMERQTTFSVPLFMELLEQKRMEIENSEDDIKNIDHLLSKLVPFENLNHFLASPVDNEKKEGCVTHKSATILQISRYSDTECKFLSSLLLNLLWSEIRLNGKSSRCDFLVVDEIQALSLKKRNAFSNMLREGRKYGLGVIASTQFISAYKKEEIETLMQAGHFIIFKPAVNDVLFSAKMIDQNNLSDWKQILSRLQIGQAVLVGSYKLNERKTIADQAIVCCIV